MTLEEALSLFLAEVALRGDLPFAVAADAGCVLSAAEQGKNWEEAFGEY
jgi:antitoxin component of RelBE/YafQ-DinJ toxin-antitoxin module